MKKNRLLTTLLFKCKNIFKSKGKFFNQTGKEGDMVNNIRYRINYTKAIETIVWLANEKPGIDIYHIGKCIFYAEKLHLNKYARPIIGDTYQKGKYGPFPSTIRDIIQQSAEWLDPDHLQESAKAIRIVNKPHVTPIPNRPANIDFLIISDFGEDCDTLPKKPK